jgi:pyrimidine operon attenuation protein/uracil phosphoribosyltransferase
MDHRILSHQQILHKINRIAYQIYEANVDEPRIVLAGIEGGGLDFARKIKRALEKICPAEILLCKVGMDKANPLTSPVTTSLKSSAYEGLSIILVDDVLKSGTTLIFGVKHFLQTPLKQLKTAVLVDRNYKKFPVKADFKGLSLSTSMEEHVRVDFSTNNYGVYLD